MRRLGKLIDTSNSMFEGDIFQFYIEDRTFCYFEKINTFYERLYPGQKGNGYEVLIVNSGMGRKYA